MSFCLGKLVVLPPTCPRLWALRCREQDVSPLEPPVLARLALLRPHGPRGRDVVEGGRMLASVWLLTLPEGKRKEEALELLAWATEEACAALSGS